MLILVLLGMYFDGAVVFVTKSSLFFRLAVAILCEITIFGLKVKVKSGLENFFLKSNKPLQSCCCPVQKNLPRKAELVWQVSQGLLYRWTEHSILPISTWGGV